MSLIKQSVWLPVIATIGLTSGICTSVANATELVGKSPYLGSSFGQQSDASTSPGYSQAFTVAPGALANALVWWGYHGVNSLGSAYDNFSVSINGSTVTGSVASAAETLDVTRYTLTFAPIAVVSGSLSVINDSLDVEWLWQSAAASGVLAPHATAVSFSLQGSTPAVPEASTSALMALGLATLALLSAQRRTTRH